MRINWYTNACVRLTSDLGGSILCDPWVNEGAFLGSWFHWPPISDKFATELFENPCDGIYISHLHPDHYDPKFISEFSRRRPEVPIYIAEFSHEWLKRSLESVTKGRTKIIELPPAEVVDVAPGLKLKIFAADTCNPLVCGVSVPCQISPHLRGIDSIGVFYGDGKVVVNANDAMGIHLVKRISANIGKADLLLGHYGGASPYPQCFPEVADKKAAAKKVVENTCGMLVAAADALEVEQIMPFAGQYVLGGGLIGLNEDRATVPLDQAVELLKTLTDRKVISINPFGEIDLTKDVKTDDYVEPDSSTLAEYLSEIGTRRFPYEKNSEFSWDEPERDLLRAAQAIIQKCETAKVGISNSFVIGDGENWVTVNLSRDYEGCSLSLGKAPVYEVVTEIEMSPQLLRDLTRRNPGYQGFTTMHWNQADVGSHFIWRRTGGFDQVSHMLLNFFGT